MDAARLSCTHIHAHTPSHTYTQVYGEAHGLLQVGNIHAQTLSYTELQRRIFAAEVERGWRADGVSAEANARGRDSAGGEPSGGRRRNA